MKKLIISMAVVVSMVLTGSIVFASQGKAFIPSWRVYRDTNPNTHYATHIWLSNISDSIITVTITLYSKDNTSGSPTVFSVDSAMNCTNYSGSSYTENPTTGSVEFEIDPYETSRFTIYSASEYSDTFGYGFVEWEEKGSNNLPTLGLVAQGYLQYHHFDDTRSYAYDITINGGNPF